MIRLMIGLGTAALVVVALSACTPGRSRDEVAKLQSTETINPGAPMDPTKAGDTGDWWDAGSTVDETITVDAALAEASFPMMVRRGTAGRPMQAVLVWYMPTILRDSTELMGYSIRYPDRVELTVMPTDFPLDVASELKFESVPNVKGERFKNRRGTVSARPAVVREPGVMKWKSGDELHYPSMVMWQVEAGPGSAAPYVTYTLYSDLPVPRLKAIAEKMQR